MMSQAFEIFATLYLANSMVMDRRCGRCFPLSTTLADARIPSSYELYDDTGIGDRKKI